jgi:hypothetical protein
MLDSARRHAAVLRVSPKAVFAVGASVSFIWLLAHDLIHPLVIYALELYLVF